jgi:hypothetical protein
MEHAHAAHMRAMLPRSHACVPTSRMVPGRVAQLIGRRPTLGLPRPQLHVRSSRPQLEPEVGGDRTIWANAAARSASPASASASSVRRAAANGTTRRGGGRLTCMYSNHNSCTCLLACVERQDEEEKKKREEKREACISAGWRASGRGTRVSGRAHAAVALHGMPVRPCSRFLVHGSRFTVHGSRFTVHGPCFE